MPDTTMVHPEKTKGCNSDQEIVTATPLYVKHLIYLASSKLPTPNESFLYFFIVLFLNISFNMCRYLCQYSENYDSCKIVLFYWKISHSLV